MGNYNAPSMGTYGSLWQAHGYAGRGNTAELIDTLKGRVVVVCGNAEGVFQEYELVKRKYDDIVVFGVNDAGMYIPNLVHWVSLHWDKLDAWRNVRRMENPDEKITMHSIQEHPNVNYTWAGLTPYFALSGYFAMQIAYIMGADLIVLCGCPGLGVRRFFEATSRLDMQYGGGIGQSDRNVQQQVVSEMNRLPEFKQKVRSMNGWTRNYFGGL